MLSQLTMFFVFLVIWTMFFWTFLFFFRLVSMIVNEYLGEFFEYFTHIDDDGLINSYKFKPVLSSSYKNYEIDLSSVEASSQLDPNESLNMFNPQDFSFVSFEFGSEIDDLIFQRNVLLYELQPHIVFTERLFSFYDYFSHSGNENKNIELDAPNSLLFIYYFFFVYLVGYWTNYYNFKFFIIIFFIPFLFYLCSFLFVLMPFSSFIPPVFTKLMREDVRENGFMRSSQLLSKEDSGLQFLLGSDFKFFNVMSAKTSAEQDRVFNSPEYLIYRGSSNMLPYSKYIRDLFINPLFHVNALSDNFSNNFLNLVIYLKIDDIWRSNFLSRFGQNSYIKDYRDVSLPLVSSTLIFPENRIESLFVSSSQAAFLDISKTIYQSKYLIFGSEDKLDLVKNLSLSRLARFYLYSKKRVTDFQTTELEQEIYEITQDALFINKRSLNLLADPFTNSLFGSSRDLNFIGLSDSPPILQFQDSFLNMIKVVEPNLNKLLEFDNASVFSLGLKFLNFETINNFWMKVLATNESIQVIHLINKFPALSLEVLSLLKNPFNCGIWSRLLVKFSNFYNFIMFFSLLFSNRFISIWKPILLNNFVSESFFLGLQKNILAYSSYNSLIDRKIKFKNKLIRFDFYLPRLSILSVFNFDPFWVNYFNKFSYKIRNHLFRVFRRLFKNPFLNYKTVISANRDRRFGVYFWKYSIEQKLSKLLVSREFKAEILGFNHFDFKENLFEIVFKSQDPAWLSFFKNLDFKNSKNYANLYFFNIKLFFIKKVLSSPVNFVYTQASKNLNLFALYNKLFESNLFWFAVLEKPAKFEAWNNFFNSIELSSLVEFLEFNFNDANEFEQNSLINEFPSLNFMDSLDERFQRLYFIRTVFRLVFKSGRSGFSTWQGLRQFNYYNYTSIKDINGLEFMFNYVYLLFKSDLSFVFNNLYQFREYVDEFNFIPFRDVTELKAPIFEYAIRDSRFRLSFDFFKQIYLILRPLMIYGEYNKSGMKVNRDLELSLSYSKSGLIDDDFILENSFWSFYRRWITTDRFSFYRKFEEIENSDEESNSFPLYSSIINSSNVLSRNILNILVKVFIKRYYNLLNSMPRTSFEVSRFNFLSSFNSMFLRFYNPEFLNYLAAPVFKSELRVLINYFKLSNYWDLIEKSETRFDIVQKLSSKFNISSDLLVFYFRILYINTSEIKMLDLKLDGFYGLCEDDLDGSFNINSRGVRQLCEFVWMTKDESELIIFEHEMEHFERLLVSETEFSAPKLGFSYDNSGPFERYLGSEFYSKFQNWLNRSSVFNDSSISRLNAFFPYSKNFIKSERSLMFNLIGRLGFFISGTFYSSYTSNSVLPFFLYVSIFKLWILSYCEIIYYNLKMFLIFFIFLIIIILIYFN